MFVPSRYIDHATKHQAHSQQISEIKFNMPVNLQSLIIVIRACNYELNTVLEYTYNHRRVPLFITFFLTALISILRTYLHISLWLWNSFLYLSLFHRAFWFTKFFHTNSCTFTYNYVLVF
jgi:hypothetical protein